MRLEPDTDPRPLNIIPYDPDVDLSERERAFCKRVLFERIHGSIIASVGRAHPFDEFLLMYQNVLNDAMFGVYDRWENRGSATHMRDLSRQITSALANAVNGVVPETIIFEPMNGLKITLRGQQHQEELLDILTYFSCETLDLQSDIQPDLFDNIEENDANQ